LITNPIITIKMLFTTVLAFAVAAAAAPLEGRQAPLCSSGSPQCCATDILGLAVLNCAARKRLMFLPYFIFRAQAVTDNVPATITPADINSFINGCADEGQQAKCCLLPILGQALLCSDVNPTGPLADPAASAPAASASA
jgi:hypothetical protein